MLATTRITEARYTTREAAAALGLPFRGLDGMLRQLGFEPQVASRGSGKPRLWSLADIVALRIGRCWRNCGVSWLRLRRAMRWIRDEGIEHMDECPVVVLLDENIWLTQPTSLGSSKLGGMPATCNLRACVAEVAKRLAAFDPQEVPTAGVDVADWQSCHCHGCRGDLPLSMGGEEAGAPAMAASGALMAAAG